MARVTFTIFICLSFLLASAQDVAYFSKLFDYQGLWQGTLVVRELSSGNFLIPSKTAGGLISDNKVFLIWLTPTGDTIETKFFQVDSTGLYFAKGDLHICPDESFVFGGTFSNEYLNIADFFLTKFNAWGDTLWFRQYKAPLNDICRGVKPTADGGFALAGKSRSFGDP
jgi:hypothetical protein